MDGEDWNATRRMVEVTKALAVLDRNAVREAINREIRQALALVDPWAALPGSARALLEVRGAQKPARLRVQRFTKDDDKQSEMLNRCAVHWHPWEGRGDLLRRFQRMQAGRDFRGVTAWRKWAYRWWKGQRWNGELPSWLRVPETAQALKMPKVKAPKLNKALTADDGTHELGTRADLRQFFAAMPRHEQGAIAVLTRAATGSVPLWMAPRESDPLELVTQPRGRPKVLTDDDKRQAAAVRQARRRAKRKAAAAAERAVDVTLNSVSLVSPSTRSQKRET